MNDQLFGGINSVGKTIRIETHTMTIVGVYDHWNLSRNFYDRSFGQSYPDNFFIPYQFAIDANLPRISRFECWEINAQRARSFRTGNKEELLSSECSWVTFWAEIPQEQLANYQSQLVNYVESQKALGRFPREIKTYVTSLDDLMLFVNENNGYINMFSAISHLFFTVCLINAIGILLAKFMRKKKEVSLRRALRCKKINYRHPARIRGHYDCTNGRHNWVDIFIFRLARHDAY